MRIFFICQKPQEVITLNVEHFLRIQTSQQIKHYLSKVKIKRLVK